MCLLTSLVISEKDRDLLLPTEDRHCELVVALIMRPSGGEKLWRPEAVPLDCLAIASS